MRRWTKEEIEIIKKEASLGKGYKQIASLINRTGKAVALKMQKLGFIFEDFYQKPVKFCESCNKEIENSGIKFCSHSCAAKVTNIKRESKNSGKYCKQCGESMRGKKGGVFCSHSCNKAYNNIIWIDLWKKGEKTGHSGTAFSISPTIRRYLFEKYDHKCCKCGWNRINPTTGKIPLQIDHLDGDASNNKEENLELICPNCHSLTSNFMALNKNSCRTHRK